MNVELMTTGLVFVAFLMFAIKRMMTYMHVLQQEDYMNDRLWKWIFENKVFDKKLTWGLLILGAVYFTGYVQGFFLNFLVFICLAIVAYLEKDPRKDGKKKLASTSRAKRIYFTGLALVAVFGGGLLFLAHHPWALIFPVQLVPFGLALGNTILKPFEEIVQKGYWDEARAKMAAYNPTVIAITGSYGKTSVKHILGHILKAHAPTLITPGSVNTPMGITRIVREQLDEGHQYLVVEMGAYGPGSIKKLCQLTPPDYGIITALGHAHYERFRSLETVAKAKFELAQAVVVKNGEMVIHERTLRFPYPREVRSAYEDSFLVCGEPPGKDSPKADISYLSKNDVHINKVAQTRTGIKIELKWKSDVHVFEVPLFGIHHGHNAALAFALGLKLGLSPAGMIKALKTLPQIDHRLEVKEQPDGSRLIDDAYNSNPLGFRSALDFMVTAETEGKKILITPGMVELGVAHDEVHLKIGEYAGEVVDVAIVVAPKRIPTFVKGFKQTGGAKVLVEVETFDEANKWLAANRGPGDLILLENDLPDIYERIPKM